MQSGWNQVHSQYGLTGKGQTVAVIDSGIAFDHVALGRGYGPGYKVVGGWDFAENDARPYDDAPGGFHGTHVSGIIGANDGSNFGVAPDVDLVALRVFTDAGKGEMAWTESALKWVHENRNSFANPITTVNLSLGSAWNSNTVPSWGKHLRMNLLNCKGTALSLWLRQVTHSNNTKRRAYLTQPQAHT